MAETVWFEFVESKTFSKQVRESDADVLTSIRSLYLYLENVGRIHLLYLFSKGEHADLSPLQKRIIGELSQTSRKERQR